MMPYYERVFTVTSPVTRRKDIQKGQQANLTQLAKKIKPESRDTRRLIEDTTQLNQASGNSHRPRFSFEEQTCHRHISPPPESEFQTTRATNITEKRRKSRG